jgi:glycosyltransferase involved in cell wall biosynthesis
MPDISVIIPCYRQAHYLPECIRSLQAQTYTDWEAIVVDDGSPDNTSAVVEAIAADDPRVSLCRKQNGGLSSARNSGLELAHGRYIQFLDADDLIAPEKFATDLSLVSQSDRPGIVISDYLRFTDDGQSSVHDMCSPRFPPDADPEMEIAIGWEVDISIPIHAVLIDTRLLQSPPLRFDESLPNHEDWDFWMRLLARKPCIAFTEKTLAMYRYAPGSMSSNRDVMYAGFVQAIKQRRADGTVRRDVAHALDRKLALTRHTYGYGWRSTVDRLMASTWVRKRVPWTIQTYVRSALQLEVKTHLYAIRGEIYTTASGASGARVSKC